MVEVIEYISRFWCKTCNRLHRTFYFDKIVKSLSNVVAPHNVEREVIADPVAH